MTDRKDVERLRAAEAETVDMASQFIRDLVDMLDWSTPEAARENLIDVVPAWVQEFGDVASSVAADWYEDTRPAALGSYSARTVGAASEDQIRASLRALLGDTADAEAAITAITGGIQRLIQYSGRATIARNVSLDPAEVRFARVPSGVKTCAWCEMLASRGFVYYTREAAGALMQYHDGCDCVLTASWDAENAYIAGYDPDAMYERYLAARGELEQEGNLGPTDKDIARRLRDMFPDVYTDGRAVPSIVTDRESGWPLERVSAVTPGRWRHILKRHGDGGNATSIFTGLTDYEIAKIMRAIAQRPDVVIPHPAFPGVANWYREIDGTVYVLGVRTKGGAVRPATAFPADASGPIMEAWRAWQNSR